MKLFSGIDYLKINIANNFGFDKLIYQDRLDWFNNNINITGSTSIEDIKSIANKSEEPELVFAGLLAYQKYLNQEQSGYRVSFDATASGIQIMSALTGDYGGMLGTNLIDPDNRYDIYTELYDIVKDKYQKNYGIELTISRKNIKQAIMVMMYGGSKSIMSKLNNNQQLFDLLMDCCNQYINGVYTLREYLLNCIDPNINTYSWITPDGFNVHNSILVQYQEERVLNNKLIQVKYKDLGTDPYYKGNVANFIHSIDGTIMREVLARCNYDLNQVKKVRELLVRGKNTYSFKYAVKQIGKSKQNTVLEYLMKLYSHTNFMTVRFIDYIYTELDAINVLLTLGEEFTDNLIQLCDTLLKYKPFEVICIHDCFTCLPNNMNYVRYWYNNVLADIVASNSFEYMFKQLPKGEKYFKYLPKASNQAIQSIRNADYAIC